MLLIRSARRATDFFITLLLWFYFLFGSIVFFFLFYMPAYVFAGKRVKSFQKLNHLHMKNFFTLTRWLIPRTKFDIQEEVRDIHSSVIVCNHLSYLDPILLISLLPAQRTIFKSTFFKVPFFGWLLNNSGYIPSAPSEMLGPAMINNLESIKEYLASGGNLFIFPEGTRSRNGKLGTFSKGVFSIARYCNAPLKLVFIKGTNQLFRPGSFSFNTRDFNIIEVRLIGSLAPDYKSNGFSLSTVVDQARSFFEDAIDGNGNREMGNSNSGFRENKKE
jgi:1-acyl-sn-glycerol-3-phosphate acyltransferase